MDTILSPMQDIVISVATRRDAGEQAFRGRIRFFDEVLSGEIFLASRNAMACTSETKAGTQESSRKRRVFKSQWGTDGF